MREEEQSRLERSGLEGRGRGYGGREAWQYMICLSHLHQVHISGHTSFCISRHRRSPLTPHAGVHMPQGKSLFSPPMSMYIFPPRNRFYATTGVVFSPPRKCLSILLLLKLYFGTKGVPNRHNGIDLHTTVVCLCCHNGNRLFIRHGTV